MQTVNFKKNGYASSYTIFIPGLQIVHAVESSSITIRVSTVL